MKSLYPAASEAEITASLRGRSGRVEPFLQIRKPFLHKAVHSAAPLQFPLSEGKVRVYVIYYKGQAVKLAVIDWISTRTDMPSDNGEPVTDSK